MSESDSPAPRLEIVNPDATAEEVAAIVAVFSALRTTPPTEKPRSLWAARHRRTRAALRPGAGSWRASGLPR